MCITWGLHSSSTQGFSMGSSYLSLLWWIGAIGNDITDVVKRSGACQQFGFLKFSWIFLIYWATLEDQGNQEWLMHFYYFIRGWWLESTKALNPWWSWYLCRKWQTRHCYGVSECTTELWTHVHEVLHGSKTFVFGMRVAFSQDGIFCCCWCPSKFSLRLQEFQSSL